MERDDISHVAETYHSCLLAVLNNPQLSVFHLSPQKRGNDPYRLQKLLVFLVKWHPGGGGGGGVSGGSVMQVHFKWSIKSSRDTVLLPSLKTMFKKSKSKFPLRCCRDPVVVVHNIYVIKNAPGATLL